MYNPYEHDYLNYNEEFIDFDLDSYTCSFSFDGKYRNYYHYVDGEIYHPYNPAIIGISDNKIILSWFEVPGKNYRSNDRPSFISNNGHRVWTNQNGVYHRDHDYPAIIYSSGEKEWYYEDSKYIPDDEVLISCIKFDNRFIDEIIKIPLSYECQKEIVKINPSLVRSFVSPSSRLLEEYKELVDLMDIGL